MNKEEIIQEVEKLTPTISTILNDEFGTDKISYSIEIEEDELWANIDIQCQSKCFTLREYLSLEDDEEIDNAKAYAYAIYDKFICGLEEQIMYYVSTETVFNPQSQSMRAMGELLIALSEMKEI